MVLALNVLMWAAMAGAVPAETPGGPKDTSNTTVATAAPGATCASSADSTATTAAASSSTTPAAASASSTSAIQFRVAIYEMNDFDLRKTLFDQHLAEPISIQKSATVWVVDRTVVETIKRRAHHVEWKPDLVAKPGQDVMVNINAIRRFGAVEARFSIGAGSTPKIGFDGRDGQIPESFEAKMSGRSLDQGTLISLNLHDAHVINIHRNYPTGPVFAPVQDVDVERRQAHFEVPELAEARVQGEWLIPKEGAVAISLGMHTVSNGKKGSVVRERVAVVTAKNVTGIGPKQIKELTSKNVTISLTLPARVAGSAEVEEIDAAIEPTSSKDAFLVRSPDDVKRGVYRKETPKRSDSNRSEASQSKNHLNAQIKRNDRSEWKVARVEGHVFPTLPAPSRTLPAVPDFDDGDDLPPLPGDPTPIGIAANQPSPQMPTPVVSTDSAPDQPTLASKPISEGIDAKTAQTIVAAIPSIAPAAATTKIESETASVIVRDDSIVLTSAPAPPTIPIPKTLTHGDLTNSNGDNPAAATKSIEPANAAKCSAPAETRDERCEVWNLSLAEAIRIGLDNDGSVRVVASKPVSDAAWSTIVIEPVHADTNTYKFQSQVTARVRSIEQAYWALHAAHTEVWSRETAFKLGEGLLKRVQGEYDKGSAKSSELAEAQQAFERFRLDEIAATSNLIASERKLRDLLGLPPSDNRRIVTVEKPSDRLVKTDWKTSLALMIANQPDILMQQEIVRRAEDAHTKALANRVQGDQSHVDLDAQFTLRREQDFLKQVIHQTTHSLARFLLEVGANHKQMTAGDRIVAEADKRLNAEQPRYDSPKIAIDRYLEAISGWAKANAQAAQYKTSYNTSVVALKECEGTLLAYDKIVILGDASPTREGDPDLVKTSLMRVNDVPVDPAKLKAESPKTVEEKPADATEKNDVETEKTPASDRP